MLSPKSSIASLLYLTFGSIATIALVGVIVLSTPAGAAASHVELRTLAAAVLVLAIGATLVIARHIAMPLASITRTIEQVAEGDLSIVIPFVGRHDEIGALARSIGVFQRALRANDKLNCAIAEEAKRRADRHEYMIVEFGRFSAEVDMALTELGKLSSRMLESSSQLTVVADGASTKTERATAASSEASENVRNIAAATDQLTASMNEISCQVAHANDVIVKSMNEVNRTDTAVNELAEATSRVGNIAKLISDIATQTNLLALNAAIEAARAGAAGRGFGVVAGEVKALAAQTAQATEEIAVQMSSMQRAVKLSIDAISAIQGTVREIGIVSGSITAVLNEQGSATQQIARSSDIAAANTKAAATEFDQVGVATRDTRASALAVRTVADDLDRTAAHIQTQVSDFFVRIGRSGSD